MPDPNRPYDFGDDIAEIYRRLRALETAPRVPTAGTQSVYDETARNPVAYDSTFRTTSAGPVDMPALTVRGSRFLVIWTWQSAGYGTAGSFRAEYLETQIQFDGVSGGVPWTWQSPSNDLLTYEPGSLIGMWETTPGEHTVQTAWRAINNGGVVTAATIAYQGLVAIPVTNQ